MWMVDQWMASWSYDMLLWIPSSCSHGPNCPFTNLNMPVTKNWKLVKWLYHWENITWPFFDDLVLDLDMAGFHASISGRLRSRIHPNPVLNRQWFPEKNDLRVGVCCMFGQTHFHHLKGIGSRVLSGKWSSFHPVPRTKCQLYIIYIIIDIYICLVDVFLR